MNTEKKLADAVAAERERCAKVVHEYFYNPDRLDTVTAAGLCAAIRATGTPEPPAGGTIGLDGDTRKCCNVLGCGNDWPCREHPEPPVVVPVTPKGEIKRWHCQACGKEHSIQLPAELSQTPAPAPSPTQEDVARAKSAAHNVLDYAEFDVDGKINNGKGWSEKVEGDIARYLLGQFAKVREAAERKTEARFGSGANKAALKGAK